MQPRVSQRRSPNIWHLFYAVLTYTVMILALWLVFIYVPDEQSQGIVYRILYFHVSSAYTMSLAGVVVFMASIIYLWKNTPWWDRVASSAVEIGTLFCTLVLITGAIWGRPIWGVWWSWDSPLTLTLVLWLIYVGYLMLRANAQDELKRARLAAVLGIVGFVDVVMIYVAVRQWRTLHPKPVVIQEGSASGLPPAMLLTFLVCLVAFSLLFFYLLRERMLLAQSQHDLEVLRHEIDNHMYG